MMGCRLSFFVLMEEQLAAANIHDDIVQPAVTCQCVLLNRLLQRCMQERHRAQVEQLRGQSQRTRDDGKSAWLEC
jgi:hypothetical protein